MFQNPVLGAALGKASLQLPCQRPWCPAARPSSSVVPGLVGESGTGLKVVTNFAQLSTAPSHHPSIVH